MANRGQLINAAKIDTRVCPNSGVMTESLGRRYLSCSTHPTKNKLLWFLALGTKQEAKHLVGLLFGFGEMCSSYMGMLFVPIHKRTWKQFVFVTRAERVGHIWITKTGGSVNAYLTDHQLKPWTPRLRWAFLIGNISRMLTHIVVGRIKRIYTTPLGEDTWKLVPGFSWTSPRHLFSFDDCKLHHLAVTITIDTFRSPVTTCNKSSSLRVFPGDPWNRSQLSLKDR